MRFSLIDLLLPRETKFYTLLEQMGDLLLTGTRTFRDLVKEIETLPKEEILKRLATIKDCEQRGDRLEAKILDELDGTFITPIDREDIQTMTIQIDKSLDILNSISRKIEMYNMRKVPIHLCKFGELIANISALACELIHDLRAKKDVKVKVAEMHKLENEADDLFHVSMAELFSGDAEFQTKEMTKYKEFYEHLETLVDCIDYFGKLVRGIRMKQG